MNWKEIRDKYPKAAEAHKKWTKGYYNINVEPDNRDLYDFFDENGIFIRVDFEFNEDGLEWAYYINRPNFRKTYVGDYYKSRKEAETEAFTKAFEILESKLKG